MDKTILGTSKDNSRIALIEGKKFLLLQITINSDHCQGTQFSR